MASTLWATQTVNTLGERTRLVGLLAFLVHPVLASIEDLHDPTCGSLEPTWRSCV